jgi:hypothetical protein
MATATNVDEVIASLTNVPAVADAARRAGLQRLAALYDAHREGLDAERRRLETKYGSSSSQAKTAADRSEALDRERVAIGADLVRVTLVPPPAGADRFVVWGRVIDSAGVGLPGVRVAAVASDGKELASASSKLQGVFELSVPARQRPGRDGATTGPGALTFQIRVTYSRRGVTVTDEEVFEPTPGRLAYRELVLRADAAPTGERASSAARTRRRPR